MKWTNMLSKAWHNWRWETRSKFFAIFLIFSFLSGAQAHLMPAVYQLTRQTTDLLLMAVCLPLLYLIYIGNLDKRLWYWAGLTYLGTFFIEAIGVHTGLIFGRYHYGATMWIQLVDVPLVIALNWTMLILAMNQIASRWSKSPWVISLMASILIAAYDMCIEPVAIQLDYWQWHGGSIPLQNYIAWSVVAFAFSWPLHIYKIHYKHPLLEVYAFAQLTFFVLLNLFFS